jgi:deferrochelatase/peroxidase EfeB
MVSRLHLGDIQGFVLRRYLMPVQRNFLMKVTKPAAARSVLGRMVSRDGADSPQITTAEEPALGAQYYLQVGITWLGLIALEVKDRVPKLSFKSFPAFVEGAAKRAVGLGEVGRSAPENWIAGFTKADDHVLFTLYARSPQLLEAWSDRLSNLCATGEAFQELWRKDAAALVEMVNGVPVPVSKVHFGYVDGIADPTIKGGPEGNIPDRQQPCEPWLFVLLEDAESYYVPEPLELGRNGSFGVFNVLQQDVLGFENFLQSHKDKIDPELLAAKICGRWRNGVPLELSADSDSPAGGITLDRLNDFEYVNEDGSGDPRGVRCPIGAHIRRVNPRGQPIKGQGVPGGSNNNHRLIRRGMPYGPAYVPGTPDDGVERGLLGYMINASIENQFEFVMREWINGHDFVGASRLNPKSKDVMVSREVDPSESVFEIPQANGAPPLQIRGFSSFVTTRASAYCFLPSISALKFISELN